MTEDEAKTKWCLKPTVEKCCASNCMAWRWSQIEEAREGEPFILSADHPNVDFAYVGKARKLRMPSGYCGLAGKP